MCTNQKYFHKEFIRKPVAVSFVVYMPLSMKCFGSRFDAMFSKTWIENLDYTLRLDKEWMVQHLKNPGILCCYTNFILKLLYEFLDLQ